MTTLQTRAEATDYAETSTHADVMAFVAALAASGDRRLHVAEFGVSGGGRALPLCVLSAHGVATPQQARAAGVPVVLWINGIHAGEVEGKEACQMMMRELLDGDGDGLLASITLVVVPLYNPDGNDAFDAGNRALDIEHLEGQCGPLLVGTRVNAAGINLNRDYMRKEAIESVALQQVVNAWQPDLTIDSHATNGSVHRIGMTWDIPHTAAAGRPEPIDFMANEVLPVAAECIRADHGVIAGWYGNFAEDERALDERRAADPAAPVSEGWMTYTHHPRFGSNYRGLTNRLDLLLECYSYQSFAERVHATKATVTEVLRRIGTLGDAVRDVIESSRTPRRQIAVRMRIERSDELIDVPTYFPRTPDGEPVTVTIPRMATFVGTVVVDRPAAYLVPADVAARLAVHGLATTPVADGTVAEVQVATVTGYAAEDGRKILESAEVGEAIVEWSADTRRIPAGYHRVDAGQPLGAIAAYLCEPESDDGAIENGLVVAPAIGTEFPLWRQP